MKNNKKGSSFGYPFLFFSVIFYLWLGFLITTGAGSWLSETVPDYASTNTTTFSTLADMVNPLSSIGFLLWLTISITLIDAYIIVSSIT